MASILHLGKYYPPDFGGIETVTEQLARGAAVAGHDVSVLCFNAGRGAPVVSVEDGVRVMRSIRRWVVASQPLGFEYLSQALRVGRTSEIVHLHWPNLLAAACVFAFPVRCKIVLHWHSDIVDKGFLGYLTRPLVQALLRRADVVIATSTNYAASSPDLRRHSRKVMISPIGIDDWTTRFSPDKPAPALPRMMSEWLMGRRVILAVGRLVPYKGFDVLIRATWRLPADVVVVIVGDGPIRRQLAGLIANEQLGDRVLLAGRLDETELRALLYRCTLFCLPSTERSEAFGVVMLEAMAAAVPIVATLIEGSGVPWVNQNGVTGINVAPNDETALADACLQILNSERLRSTFGTGARARFVQCFDSRVTLGQVLALYKQMTSHSAT